MKAPHTITLDKDKILDQIKDLRAIAEKEGWKYDYDSELDELTFGKDYMPRDSFLVSINDELNLFVSPDSTVNGIFIEYFGVNFIEHNIELRPVVPILKKASSERSKESKEERLAKEALENELLADAFKSIYAKPQLTAII